MTNPPSREIYLKRINKAVNFIMDNLDGPLNLESVARSCHFSPFHFHRIFHAITGETVNDFIIRKRMEKAACRLLRDRRAPITHVAELGGFSSSANFSKQFKLYFGITPGELRRPHAPENSKIGKLRSKYGKEFDHRDLYSQFVTHSAVFDNDKLEKMLMNVQLHTLRDKHIVYLTAPKGYDLDTIFETWDKISHWAESAGVPCHETKRYAICHDNPMITPAEKCRYDACIEVDSNTPAAPPLSKAVIPGGKYAIAHYKGDGDKVSKFYMELYSQWLPNSGFEPDNYPPVAYYLNDSRQDGFVDMEVHIKLKVLAS